jgi:pantetheine-phosphate adenylyltransferase
MTTQRVGVYPGTFDPITNGHMNIILRGARLVDKLYVAVANNDAKGPMFKTQERVEIVRDELTYIDPAVAARIEVISYANLLVQLAVSVGATIIIRGLRAVADFEYEIQMTSMNARIEPTVDTIFLTASDGNLFIASRLVKEICQFGGDISPFVSPRVEARLKARFAKT